MVFNVLPNSLFVFYEYTFEKSIYDLFKCLNKLSINQSINQYNSNKTYN